MVYVNIVFPLKLPNHQLFFFNLDIFFLTTLNYNDTNRGTPMEKLLKLLKDNARLTNSELAVLLNRDEALVASQVKDLEASGVIKGYKTLINEQKLSSGVSALIELKVTPKKEYGLDRKSTRLNSSH